MRIGFLLPRDDVHHVAHIVPAAISLAELRADFAVSILTYSFRSAKEVDWLLPVTSANLHHWRVGRSEELGDRNVLADDRELLSTLDAVVTTEPDMTRLRRQHRLGDIPVIYMRPGASDFTAGLDQRVEGFDHILVQGDKIRDRLIETGSVDGDRVSVIGCPKFDAPPPMPAGMEPADGRPIVLYNPHYSPEVSSWFRWGTSILNWFADNPDYRLIFAPHVRLFDQKRVRRRGRFLPQRIGRIDPRWLEAPNIHIDVGSTASMTRAYTEVADIYVGDAGGQLYEFIHRPRPCGFLYPHGLAAGGVGHERFGWGAGIIIEKTRLFGDLLRTAQEWHEEVHAPVQREMFDYSISVTDEPARHRAAMAIAKAVGA